MTITNLEEKENRKLWVPIRDGNRGGWSLFNWEDVRDKSHKEREMYLGNSVTLGVLDKGGKWRKRDWYTRTDKKYKSGDLISQQQEAMRRDTERMNSALSHDQREDEQKLTEQEMKELLKRVKQKKGDEYELEEKVQLKGLGFDKNKGQNLSKPKAYGGGEYKLEGIDQEDDQKRKFSVKQQKRGNQRDETVNGEREKRHKKHKKNKHKDKQHTSRERGEEPEHKDKQRRSKHKHKNRHRDRSRSQERSKKHQKRRRRHSSSEDSQ